MTSPTSVTAEELVRGLRKRRATLPAEIGSFVVLEACEALVARGPMLLSPANVAITEEGAIELGDAPRAAEQEAAYALHGLLAAVLVAAGPAPHPALMRLVEQGPSNGRWTLASLRDDLEASLVPLNRKASRRVLARLVREVGWGERAQAKRPSFDDLDSELSSFLGEDSQADEVLGLTLNSTRARPQDADVTRRDAVESIDEAADQVRFFESARPIAREPTGKTVLDPSPSYAERMAPVLRDETERMPPLSYRPRAPRPLDVERPKQASGALWVGALLLFLSGAVVLGTLYLRPELWSKLTDAPAPPTQSKAPDVAPKTPLSGDLEVRVTNPRAQILRFVGRGPATVPNLPLGVAHEFVAMAEGMAAARLLIPPDAEWETTAEGRRYEAAMQLGPAAKGNDLELGETLLPKDVGSPSTTLGSVRIVTTPKGAKVYQVIGFAPSALIEGLPVDATEELYVYAHDHKHEVRVIAPSDYVGEGPKKRAVLELTLEPLPRKKK